MADSPDDDLGRLTEELDARDAPTKAPFIGALVLVALLIGLILIAQFANPFHKRLSPEDQVRVVISDQYTARNAIDYAGYLRVTCQEKAQSRADFLAQNTVAARDANGKIVIPEITGVVINDDKASATVVWNYEKKAAEKTTVPTTLVRQQDGWKVCS
ncbi:MAG: hypothetical protein QM728_13220 [Gordonia sp. (in: high G+C Gram-positive bacteria)]|uniref:Rv0361 family membrane protein n=1 Tax=Gordonia sp. (in: high G+C Gram-positive bacteria) TaxID=84139 RepID=UPI0039E52FDC